MEKTKIEKITIENRAYPSRLRNIKDAPEKIYVLGRKEILSDNGIAIVGSRDCTDEGIRNARIFSANIAKEGFSIISGMAKGIDSAAHQSAIDVKGKTIAVLGCGVDYIYPEENKKLYEEIIKSGGAVISEYPIGTLPESENFRRRNRIVSGLSLGILVVEAEYRSGTTITAGYAKSQGKEVFCIPNSRENRKGIGTNILIKKGATMVLEPKEILEKIGKTNFEQLSLEDIDMQSRINLNHVKDEYKDIYLGLKEGLSITEISIKTKQDCSEIYSKLFMMELEGIISKNGSNYILN